MNPEPENLLAVSPANVELQRNALRTDGANSIIICFVWRSIGELHCLLPILRLAKDNHPRVRIVVAFRLGETRQRFEEDRVYAAMLKDMDAEILPVRGLLRYVLFNRRRVGIIFKDFASTPTNSLPVQLKLACPNASLVLFPHAYALHTSGQEAPAITSVVTTENFAQNDIDRLLLSSQLDVETWTERLPLSKMNVMGATGYTEWWGQIMRQYAHEHLKSIRDRAAGRKLVLLTTRAPHDLYLTEENYQYLVKQSIDSILKRPDTFILVKPHPREDKQHLLSLLADFPQERLAMVELSTLALASICSVTVSFWSSAILDSIAVGTPAVEFHRFHRPIPQSVRDATGRIVSIYTRLGLALRADDSESLVRALDSVFDDHSSLLASQRQALAPCFPDNEAQLGSLRALLSDLLSAPPRSTRTSWRVLYKLVRAILATPDTLPQSNQQG
jgi:hypothetical protein